MSFSSETQFQVMTFLKWLAYFLIVLNDSNKRKSSLKFNKL